MLVVFSSSWRMGKERDGGNNGVGVPASKPLWNRAKLNQRREHRPGNCGGEMAGMFGERAVCVTRTGMVGGERERPCALHSRDKPQSCPESGSEPGTERPHLVFQIQLCQDKG